MFEKTLDSIKKIYSEIIEKAKAIPEKIGSYIKKPETKCQVLKTVGILFAMIMAILVTLWAITLIFSIIQRIIERYGIYILGVFCILCWFLGWIQTKKDEALKRKKKELAELYKRAEPNYKFLRNFLYTVLTEHFCQLTELYRPLTPNLLTENPPFDLDSINGILSFFFKVEKRNPEPLEKGVENVINLLQSVITQRIEATGIEGICSATTDPLCSVVAIHNVEDLGSHVRITYHLHTWQEQTLMSRTYRPCWVIAHIGMTKRSGYS